MRQLRTGCRVLCLSSVRPSNSGTRVTTPPALNFGAASCAGSCGRSAQRVFARSKVPAGPPSSVQRVPMDRDRTNLFVRFIIDVDLRETSPPVYFVQYQSCQSLGGLAVHDLEIGFHHPGPMEVAGERLARRDGTFTSFPRF